ncbi:hypothetical protein PPL_00511 [Heterostelium album PN500]|uniref:Uncharacterized protein n=1 Tax=Heterostelium pallidum (strain ATCC 26659 / Pp 5 / PN500) TaxID=670386 RepID=D3AWN5_HETP5|nr:hypothetical protein PPL_00511 [Heterostelium album PN500]EFA86708.1 hypothetical protein PPL_00511 [Heterostelium album PN500]|eukprot:XP_020438812.1 hypothetical protein PPL_00511 [Heterostelium album PN500]
MIYRQVYANSGATPLISYKRYLKAQMHLERIKKIYKRTGDSIGYPWKTDKINIIDRILKENNISTTEFEQNEQK